MANEQFPTRANISHPVGDVPTPGVLSNNQIRANFERGDGPPPFSARIGEGAILGALMEESAMEEGEMTARDSADNLTESREPTTQSNQVMLTEGQRNREIFLVQFNDFASELDRVIDNYEHTDTSDGPGSALSLAAKLMTIEYISSSPELLGKAQRVYAALDAANRADIDSNTVATLINLKTARHLLHGKDTTPLTAFDAGVTV